MSNAIPPVVRSVTQRMTRLRDHIDTLCRLGEAKLSSDQLTDKEQTHICQILNTIQNDLRQLIDLKRRDSFAATIIGKAPETQHTIGQIEGDYDTLLSDVEKIVGDLVEDGHGLKARKQLHSWISRFRSLDARECDLLQKVWTVDIGAMD
jgi:hypothetical protein